MSTLTIYPDYPPVNTQASFLTSGDSSSPPSHTAWIDYRNGIGGSVQETPQFDKSVNVGDSYLYDTTIPQDSWYTVQHAYAGFDTSPLTAGATITDAYIEVYGTFIVNDFSETLELHVATATPLSNTSLDPADWLSVGRISVGHIVAASFNTGQYNKIQLTDFSVINKTGITNLSFQTYDDLHGAFDGTIPSRTIDPQTFGNAFFFYGAGSGIADMRLVVTYSTVPAVSTLERVSGQVTSGVQGQTISVCTIARDSNGSVISGATVNFSLSCYSGSSLSASSAVTNSNGQACVSLTFGTLTSGRTSNCTISMSSGSATFDLPVMGFRNDPVEGTGGGEESMSGGVGTVRPREDEFLIPKRYTNVDTKGNPN